MGNVLCCTCVDQASTQVIEQCGRYTRTAHPGYNCVWCCVGEAVAGSLSLRIQQLDVKCETKTKDNVFVDVICSVQFQVVRESIYDAFYKLTDAQSQIRSYVFDVVRATVPKMNLDDVFTSKEEIAVAVKSELTKSMAGFGFSIIQALITDIEPAAKVKNAMNEINAAQRMRVAATEIGEAEKIRVIKAAEADAEAKYLAGQGVARQRQAIVSGLRESVQAFQSEVTDVNAKDVMQLVLITQYFDTLKDLAGKGTIFVSHSPGAVADVASQIQRGFLEAQAANQTMQR